MMVLSTKQIFSILKSIVLLENIDFFNPKLNLNKCYTIIAILFLSFASHFFVFVPSTFAAESSLNLSSSSMINSTVVEELFNKANNFYDQEKYDEAIKYYDKALAIDPQYVSALNGKANLLQDLKRYDEAIQYFDKALAIDPNDVDVLSNKAIVLQNLKRYDEALEYYDKALAIDQ